VRPFKCARWSHRLEATVRRPRTPWYGGRGALRRAEGRRRVQEEKEKEGRRGEF
jgi:hypothetical protein